MRPEQRRAMFAQRSRGRAQPVRRVSTGTGNDQIKDFNTWNTYQAGARREVVKSAWKGAGVGAAAGAATGLFVSPGRFLVPGLAVAGGLIGSRAAARRKAGQIRRTPEYLVQRIGLQKAKQTFFKKHKYGTIGMQKGQVKYYSRDVRKGPLGIHQV